MADYQRLFLVLLFIGLGAVTRSGEAATEIVSMEAQELALFKCLQASYNLPPQVIEHLNETNIFIVNAIAPSAHNGKFQIETSLNGYEGVVQLSSDNLVFINKYKHTKSLKGDEETVGTFRLIAEDRAERIVKFVEENKNQPGLTTQIKASFMQCPISSIGGQREDTPFLQRLTTNEPPKKS
ncbi:MAG: hypothetical protein K2X47_20725 [Bdellovibrionales bacterium]|nr:hypothetical protein [Bdellovibrionales bacterium]